MMLPTRWRSLQQDLSGPRSETEGSQGLRKELCKCGVTECMGRGLYVELALVDRQKRALCRFALRLRFVLWNIDGI